MTIDLPIHERTRPTIRVLVVDDSPVSAELLSGRLNREPDMHSSTCVLAQAAAALRGYEPNVVVVDSDSFPKDGNGLAAWLTLANATHRLVVVSDEADASAVRSTLNQGASGYVAKSAPAEDLVLAIRYSSRGETWISPLLLASLLKEQEPTAAMERLEALSKREREVLGLMVDGLSYSDIASRLGLSRHTVRTHGYALQVKLGVHSRVRAVAVALEAGLRPTAEVVVSAAAPETLAINSRVIHHEIDKKHRR